MTGGDTSRRCNCPEDRCWYDEQKERRARGLLAIDTDTWPPNDASAPDEPSA